jgi:uncharacterized cupredoxin-like copper-binding protein
MHLARLAALATAAVLLAACSGGGSASSSSAPDASAPVEASATATRVAVILSDRLTIEPAAMTVPVGQAVTFVVTNSGAIEHEFVLGDEEVQAEHASEMAGGHMDEDETAITVPPGETKELTTTFEAPGSTLAGCHVAGHYEAGMRATITIR